MVKVLNLLKCAAKNIQYLNAYYKHKSVENYWVERQHIGPAIGQEFCEYVSFCSVNCQYMYLNSSHLSCVVQ